MNESGPRGILRRKKSAFLAFASFFLFQGGFMKPAEAQTQTTPPPTERQILLYGITSTPGPTTEQYTLASPSSAELMASITARMREENPQTAPTSSPTPETADPNTETIIVTAPRLEDFSAQTNPEFEGNFFTRNGITAVHNPDFDGLAYLTREEALDAQSWNAARFHLGGSGEGERGAFFDLEAGRGHGVRAGWRF